MSILHTLLITQNHTHRHRSRSIGVTIQKTDRRFDYGMEICKTT